MQEYANFGVVIAVLVASFALLYMLVYHSQRVSADAKSQADLVIRILTLWIFAWLAWTALWSIRAFFPYKPLSKEDFAVNANFIDDLNKTNGYSPYIRGLLGITNDVGDTEVIINKLNGLIISKSLYDGTHIKFDNTNLSPNTLKRLGTILDGKSLVAFNRQLLSDLYKNDFDQNRTPPVNWQQFVTIVMNSLNAVFFLLIVIVVLAAKNPLSLFFLFMTGLCCAGIIAVYYLAMYGLSHLGDSSSKTFAQLLLHWSVSESIIAPLVLAIAIWKFCGPIWPLVFGLLYAFAQPIVYQADVEDSSGLTLGSREAILISLAFLKILFAASVLYAIGRYAKKAQIEGAFKTRSLLLLKTPVKFSDWNFAVGSLVILGTVIWYIFASKVYSGVSSGASALWAVVTVGTTGYRLINGEKE